MSSKIQLKTLTTATLTAGLASFLIAAGPAADLNQDGQVTRAEFDATTLQHFQSADANGDGMLTEEERKTLREARRTNHQDRKFDELDTNGDSFISKDEFKSHGDAKMERRTAEKEARKTEILSKYDIDQDGQLSDDEKTALKADRRSQHGKRSERPARGERPARDERPARGEHPHQGKRPNPDSNADGLVSQDEFLAFSAQLFERMDVNGDGVLVKDEARKSKPKRRGFFRRKAQD